MISADYKHTLKSKERALTYKSAYIAEPGVVRYKDLKLPVPRNDEVLVRLIGCGLCASNIPVWEGREWLNYPMEPGAPGHEGWGIVEEAGLGVENVQPGQLVTVLSNNAFAEYVLAKESDIIPIPERLEGIPFPGEPFGCVMNVLERADIRPGHTVCIIGLGFIGLSLISLLKNDEVNIIALSRRDASLALARELGAATTIKMEDHYKIIEQLKHLTDERGCERVIECTGKQWPLDLAGELAGTYGKLIVAGYHQDGIRNVNMQLWNRKGLDVINAHERDPEKYREGIREAIRAVVRGDLDPNQLLTHSFEFTDLTNGLNVLKECPEGYIKGYIKF